MAVKTRPSLMPEAATAPGAAARKKAAAPAEPMRWYRVADGPRNHNVPNGIGPFRRDHGDFFLKIGNEISSGEYDIKLLKNHGCKLEEIEPPGWFVEQQQLAAEKAEQLREAGVDVGDVPEYEATPLAKKAPAREAATSPEA